MSIRSPKHGLTRTARGWVKKINGETRWVCSRTAAPTPEAADAIYESRMTELWGEVPAQPPAPGLVTLKELADRFADRKERAGVHVRTLADYEAAIQDFLDVAGSARTAAELTPADFAKARAAWANRFGPDRLAKFIINVRGMFKWGRKPPLRLPEPDYGDEFDIPAKPAFRKDRKATREEHGARHFEAGEVGKLLDRASRNMRAMILLALNGGFGNTDLATLPRAVIDLAAARIDYARTKTGVDRRVPLWTETVEAVRAVIDYKPRSRRHPEAWESPRLLFQTRQGRAYVDDRRSGAGKLLHKDRIGTEFSLLCEAAGVHNHGRGFYGLRRTFRTLADECGDQRAAALIMGHETGDIGGIYVQVITDQRLLAIINHVRQRLAISGSGAGKAAGA